MRINFATPERAKRVSKHIHSQLSELGHQVPYSRVQAATAVMYGYVNWNDLLGQCGRNEPSPLDDDVSNAERAVRSSWFATRLSEALGIPLDDAEIAVHDVGPTRSPKRRESWSAEAAIGRISNALALTATSATAVVSPSGFHGFRITRAKHRPLTLAVSADGRRIAYRFDPVEQESAIVDDDEDRTSDFGYDDWTFGMLLKQHGLAGAPTTQAAAESIPDCIASTIGRLDRGALELLHTLSEFSPRCFEMAVALPLKSPYRDAVKTYPLLAMELHLAAHSVGNDLIDDFHARVIASADPVSAYLDNARRWLETEAPNLPFDRHGAFRAFECISRTSASPQLDFMRSHIAILSFAPESCLPKTAGSLRACLEFFRSWDDILSDDIDPWEFFREFDRECKGDWKAFLDKAGERRMRLIALPGEVGDAIARRLASEIGMEPMDFQDNAASSAIGHRMRARMFKGKGLLQILRETKKMFEGGEDVSNLYLSLSTSALMPQELRNLSACDLIGKIGFTVREIADPVDGLIADKRLFHTFTRKGLAFKARSTEYGLQLTVYRDYDQLGGVEVNKSILALRNSHKNFEPGWHLCKYDTGQPRVALPGFTEQDVRDLAAEFGIEKWDRDDLVESQRVFPGSAAAKSLWTWIHRRPELAAQNRATAAFPDPGEEDDNPLDL